MTVALLLIDDGRPYREETLRSAAEHLPVFDELVEVNDPDHELGFDGAIAEGWDRIARMGVDYVFHLEADFTFNAQIPVDQICAVLKRQAHLAQVCLKRQPWNEAERAAGGIVELRPDDYEQRTEHGDIWTEHRVCFSTNPCVYPAALCAQGWPQEPESEGIFTHRLLEDARCRFAFWGAKHAPPLCEHIGIERTGSGY